MSWFNEMMNRHIKCTLIVPYYYEEKNDSKIRNGLITDIDSIIREGIIKDIVNTNFLVKIETQVEEKDVTFQNFFNYFCKFKDELIGKIKNFSKK